jgi:hypothetical protein
VRPVLLRHEQLLTLFAQGPLTNITGREPEVHPEGVINIEPYIRSVPSADLLGFKLPDEFLVEVVYQTFGGDFDVVNIMTRTKNVFLVVVVDNKNERIHGHLILDLNKEYGLDAANDA